MFERRKDSKGRVLKEGESQRSDGSYQYRYTDNRGKRKYVYSKNLDDLREKEHAIEKAINDGLDYAAGEITLMDLVKRYLAQKQGMRYNTLMSYDFVLNILKDEDFCFRKVNTIKPSDAKIWVLKLRADGRRYSTIQTIRGVVKPAFNMAVDEDIIRKNPFDFTLTSVIPDDTEERRPLTVEEEEKLLAFIQADKCRSRYYDVVVILLGTGLRISELCGLTISDVDFKNRRLRVERQLVRTKHCEYYTEKPKTASGTRYIPLTNEKVYQAFRRVVQNRKKPKFEMIVDGVTGFFFLDQEDKPKVAGHFQHALKRIVDKYNKTYGEHLVVTPHVFRHTFCTRMAQAGMPVKELQYLMGNADVGTTLSIYAHMDYDAAEKSYNEIVAKAK